MGTTSASTLLQIDHVSKKYCRDLHRSLRYGVVDLCREAIGLGPVRHLRKGEFYAVRDVSLTVKRGEAVLLMGSNGAGKSTLLKMVNGLIRPDEGRIRVRGRMAALTQLGAGFNPVLTGRENAYINAAVLGFSKAEMNRSFDEMVDFAELEDAIDSPVRSYSSGMRARLGYAIATFLKPDLLLMDEVLATGDIAFRMKCYDHLEKLIAGDTAVIIVTHSLGRITKACNRFVFLQKGRLVFDGNMEEGVDHYIRSLKLSDAVLAEWPAARQIQRKNSAANGKVDEESAARMETPMTSIGSAEGVIHPLSMNQEI